MMTGACRSWIPLIRAGNLFSLASGGAIYLRDPYARVEADQLNGGVFGEVSAADWVLIEPYLQENERLFGITIEAIVEREGQLRSPGEVYRKVQVRNSGALASPGQRLQATGWLEQRLSCCRRLRTAKPGRLPALSSKPFGLLGLDFACLPGALVSGYDLRVELSAAAAQDFFIGLFDTEQGRVGAWRRHRIQTVGQGDNACPDGDILARQTVRITAAIPPLVVVANDGHSRRQQRDILDHLCPGQRMAA